MEVDLGLPSASGKFEGRGMDAGVIDLEARRPDMATWLQNMTAEAKADQRAEYPKRWDSARISCR